MKRHGKSVGESVLLVLAAIFAVLLLMVVIYGALGLLAAGLVSLIFHAVEYDSGLSFGQLWLAGSAAVALFGWVGSMFKGEPIVKVKTTRK